MNTKCVLTTLLFVLLLFSCSKNELLNSDIDKDGFHTISLKVSTGQEPKSREANSAETSVTIEDLVLFAVDKESRIIVDTALMAKHNEQSYSCRIPLFVDLSKVDFYAVANSLANFESLESIENSSFDDFLNMPVKLTYNNINGATILNYTLMNREAATYNSSTKSLSSIALSHLPARIFLDCSDLGYPLEEVSFSNLSRTASLRNLVEKNGTTNNYYDWSDEKPAIPAATADGQNNYYYLVYPSDQLASVVIKANGVTSSPVQLGKIVSGSSYKIRITYSKQKRVVINGEDVGTYLAGVPVTIKAPFKNAEKFVKWTSNQPLTRGDFEFTTPTLMFTMPDMDVNLTAEYTVAPYKVIINKPGKIINDREGNEEEALVFDAGTAFVRYYALGDEVRILTPSISPTIGSEFRAWEKSASTHNNIYWYINNNGGGGQQPTTWFKAGLDTDVELSPAYKRAPYWSSQSTPKGHLIANFIESENTESGQITIPGGAKLHRAMTQAEKAAVMGALTTIENTFANAPRRPIKIVFAIFDLPGSGIAAATNPITATHISPYDSPKNKWTAADFKGRATGMVAVSSKFEAVWRDGLNIAPQDADDDNKYVGFCDGLVVFNHSSIKDTYMGESSGSISSIQTDFQSIVLHELAHIVCYHSLNKGAGPQTGLMALDVFVANKKDRNLSLVNGNMVADDGGEAIIDNQLVRSYYGGDLEVVSTGDGAWDFGHLNTSPGEAVGSQYQAWGSFRRTFTDFELAFLQEMGWQINPAAWQKPPALYSRHR